MAPLVSVIDTCVFDVYVKRSLYSGQNLPMETRPCLTMLMDPVSRRVLASCVSEQRPGQENIKALLYDAFFALGEDKRSVSLSDEISVEAGIDTWSPSIQSLAQEFHLTRRSASLFEKGALERFFSSVQRHVDDPSEHPTLEWTVSELKEWFIHFIEHYHQHIQPSTGLTPLESWQKQDSPSPVNPLPLLQESHQRRVMKDGIHVHRRVYWHVELAPYFGKEVSIRVPPPQPYPETIDVFFEQRWICSAYIRSDEREDFS